MRLRPKEPFNSFSHAFGCLLSIFALVILLWRVDHNPFQGIGYLVYGLSLVVLYAASATFHGLHVSPRVEEWLRRFDHMAIFLLIAGSYTPICLVTLGQRSGGTLCALVWGIAAAGIFLKLFFPFVPNWISAAIYLGMGWMAVIEIVPLTQTLPLPALLWLFGGGLAYSAGAVIYALERPDPYPLVFGHHEIFHIFVLAGSALHFVFIMRYVA